MFVATFLLALEQYIIYSIKSEAEMVRDKIQAHELCRLIEIY